MITIKEIRKRIIDDEGENGYLGFDMSKTNGQEITNKNIDIHNRNVLELFDDYIKPKEVMNFFDCWKGVCSFIKVDNTIKNFNGWETEKIIKWIIKNSLSYSLNKEKLEEKLKEKDFYRIKDIKRLVTVRERYEVLKRQKWRCNICNVGLRFSKKSKWKGEIAHIDYIPPYSKRKSYLNGEERINEIENLQALCPNCNFRKGSKAK